jgi:trypsin
MHVHRGLQVLDEWVLAKKLRKVDLPIISREKCTTLYEGFIIGVTENMICAGDEEGGKSVCSGDSGGPAVDSSGVLVGLASWVGTCGVVDDPGVYTRVGNYIEWIADTFSKWTM